MEESELIKLIESGDEMRKFSDYFELRGFLGKGAFGIVVRARNLTTDQMVAIKVVSKKAFLTDEMNQLQQEALILSQLRHQNIVRFIDLKETDLRFLIVMEYIEGGSLQDLMTRRLSSGEWFSEEECKNILRSILEALAYIHERNIVHRDLKPDNILIRDDLSCVKLGDFGLSAGYRHDNNMQKQCGTITYMAPELLQGKVYNKAVDIWSVGVIMYNLLFHAAHPYYEKGDNVSRILERMKQMHKTVHLPEQSNINRRIQLSLFRKLTEIDHSKRYAASQCLYHPWLDDKNQNEVPQTMEEMFQTWQNAQHFLALIKAMMMLQAFGFEAKCEHLQICLEVSARRPHQFNKLRSHQINKEFYDKLFEDYQKSLTEQQKLQLETKTMGRRQSITLDTCSNLSYSPPLVRMTPKSSTNTKFIIKTRKIPLQNSAIIQEDDLREEILVNKTQTPIDASQVGDLQDSTVEQIDLASKTENQGASPTKSNPKRKRQKQKTQIKILIQRTDSINQSQDESMKEEVKPFVSQQNSPARIRPAMPQGSKFKIQLRLPEAVPAQSKQSQLPQITNFVPLVRDGRPRQGSMYARYSRLSIIERDKICPNVLDLTSMALGSVSPVHSNQFLFPQRNNSNQVKRMYPNEFHPSKILSSKKQSDIFYNFINGGPK